MKYGEIKIEGCISNFIKCFWTSETIEKSVEHTILPDGFFDLIVEIKKEKVVKIKLTGFWTIPIDVKAIKNTKIFAVRFKPLAIELLENIDLKSLLNSSITLDKTFLGLDTLSYENIDNFCLHIESHFKRRLEEIKPISELKIRLFDIISKKEIYSVKELSEKSFWPSRQINRYFTLNFGLSLKTYLNVIRCNSTFKNISQKKLSFQTTYFDQAHYIKEIKKLTGLTPSQLSKNENDRFLQLLTLKGN